MVGVDKLTEPRKWPNIEYPEVDYQDMIYYSAPKQKATKASLDEVDPELLPGLYQFGPPDEMLAEGSARAVLLIRFPDTVIKPVEINLVAYDPQDAERIGVWSLAGHKRHEFLRQALPRFTEMELAMGEQTEKELAAKLSAEKGS